MTSDVRPVRFPDEYGDTAEERFEWSYIEDQIRPAINYWMASIGPSGAPHVRPIDGVWIDGALVFGGSDEARWVRNITERPRVSINLPGDDLAVIMEGEVEYVTDESHPLTKTSQAASRAKYPQYYKDEKEGEASPFMPFWMLRPRVVYAWTLTGFPKKATRWKFDI